ncbi:MAG: type IV pilus assembly protein PilM [Methylophilaceae bacterium]
MKFDFFSKSTPSLMGVDISTSAVKIVELSRGRKNGYHLKGYSIASVPKDAIVDGNIVNLEQISDAVQLAWKLLGSNKKQVALALPSSAVITKKVLLMAGLSEDEMEIQVEGEANQYIPFPLEEVNIDFQIIGPVPNNPEDAEVLIAAARKEKIEDRVAAAEGAGLEVIVMDVDTYATEAAYALIAAQLPKSSKGQAVMIVDMGATMMHINVLNGSQSIYVREQAFGCGQLTQEIQRRFGLSAEEAELAKRKGGLPDSYEVEVLLPFIESLANEVVRALQFFTSSTQYNGVNHIVLAGGGAVIPAIDEAVKAKTQINTTVANPFHAMSLGSKVNHQQIAMDAPTLMVACGLAMRGVS